MDDDSLDGGGMVGVGGEFVPLRRGGPEELVDDRYLLDALLANTPDHVYFKDAQSRFLRISDALANWLGLSDPSDAIGKTDFDYFGEEHSRKAFADEQLLMQTDRPLVAIEEQETWADGRQTWVSTTKVPLRDRNGNVAGVFGISRDITERKQAEELLQEQARLLAVQAETLEELASRDELTGLYNRRGLATVGPQMLYEARLAGSTIGVVFIDLDGLKSINDHLGHHVGDQVLQAAAAILAKQTRPTDVVARVGGDEFCLLIHDATEETISSITARIDAAIANHNQTTETPLSTLSLSLGSHLADPSSRRTITELMERADSAMYDSKRRRTDDRLSASK
ncbi:GGDEF domain-containing protein [Gaiella sp.]|uniref:GGDEF domain-containing protein n=1 Tax=Gaiella sp. TaxID=2663207 RepID=UPI003983A7B2